MNMIPWRRRPSLLPISVDFDDLLSRFWGNGDGEIANRLPEVFQSRGFPAVNFAETETGFTITMDCPGLDEKDISVETMGNNVVISGERKWEEEKKGKEYHRVESQYGKFERTVPLPDNVRIEAGEVEAQYKKGVLTIEIPKLEKTPAAKIPVRLG
jgi:HSP20 family protein